MLRKAPKHGIILSMDNKRKHLEFIQDVIKRMASNSFLLRGWSITLVTAIVTMANNSKSIFLLFIALFLIFVFWSLDAYYLSQERQYRELYKSVILKDELQIDFSMNAKDYDIGENTWFSSMFSKIFKIFYGSTTLLLIIIIIYYFPIQTIINRIYQ